MNKNILGGVGVVVALLLSIIAIASPSTTQTVREVVTGGSAGPEQTERQFHLSGSTNGSRYATTSTASTYTFIDNEFTGTPTYIDWLPNLNTTLSITATSTHKYVPRVGDVAKIYLRNASTTATASITLAAANANVDLQDNEDSADLVILGLDWAELTLIREDTYLVTVMINETTEAD